MKNLNAKIGKYAVDGNWEFNNSKLLEQAGFKSLNNGSIRLSKDNESFNLSGLDFGYERKLSEIIKNQSADSFSIFLYHAPDLIEEVAGSNIDLYLSGHTHGGQIRLPFYGAIITLSKYCKKYEMGRYKVNNTVLYVNRGLGMEGGNAPRVRFLARPEITVFDIKPNK